MSGTLHFTRVPYCTRCLRSYISGDFIKPKQAIRGPTQIRCKSKRPKAVAGPEETVKLLKPMKGIGRIGDIVNIRATEMKRVWIPHRIAVYVTPEELRVHLARDTPQEIGTDATAYESQAQRLPATPRTNHDTPKPRPIKPVEIYDILESTIPAELTFFRKAVPVPKRVYKDSSKEKAQGAASDLLAVRTAEVSDVKDGTAITEVKTSIYGAVLTQDVKQAISDLLRTDERAARIVVAVEDIKFVGDDAQTETSTKIKHIGEHSFEVSIPGHDSKVQRKINIRSDADQAS